MQLEKNQSYEITIDSIASDGNGVGRVGGMVVFVPLAAPGDRLRVRIVKVSKRHAFGRLEKVLKPGPGRIEGDCPVGHLCGGCDFRHLTYEAELAAKQGFVRDALARIAKIELPVPLPLTTGETTRYRNKMSLPVAPGADGGLVHGFYAARSHRIIPCDDCLLQPQTGNRIAAQTVAALQELGAQGYDEATGQGLVRHISLRRSHTTDEYLLCVVAAGDELPGETKLTERLTAAFPEIKGILLNTNRARTNVIFGERTRLLWGRPFVRDSLCGVPVRLDATGFCQVNPQAAELLFGIAREYAAPTPETQVLDLYCGSGVIGLSMARQAGRLVGVEIAENSIAAARQTAEEMELTNCRFLQGDAAAAAQKLASEGFQPDVVILDPPRKGAGEATVCQTAAFAPARVVMVSCNPATLARDLVFFAEKGYFVRKMQPVDLFPRTRHVECVCLLERQS